MVSPFQVHYILAELVMGGMVLETNMTEIITRIEEQAKLEKQEVCVPECPLIMMNLIIGASCHKCNFCGDKSFVMTNTCFCHDKSMLVTNICHDKIMFVTAKLLSQQTNICHNRSFVATNMFCPDKHNFVMSSIFLSLKQTRFVMTNTSLS